MTREDEATVARLESTGEYKILKKLCLDSELTPGPSEMEASLFATQDGPDYESAAQDFPSEPTILDFRPFHGRRGSQKTGTSRSSSDTISDEGRVARFGLRDTPLETMMVGAIVDVETTGVDPDRDRIIELAVRMFRFDAHGRIMSIGPMRTWLEDPGTKLDPAIVRLTGLNDGDLVGHVIDDEAATALLNSADILIAHNAGFDRKFVERRLPQCGARAWACTLREVDWPAHGFSGASLPWLLAQAGFFHGAHRAGADVDAVVALLRHRAVTGETALFELLDRASRVTWLISAIGAPYDVKDQLKSRGYKWNSVTTVWQREVGFADRAAEEEWLRASIYDPRLRPKAGGPRIERRDWTSRHA